MMWKGVSVDSCTWCIECFKHDLCHFFSICFWIEWSFSKKNWMFFRCNTKFIVESMMPNFFHIIPVGNNAMFNGIFKSKNTPFWLCFITYIWIFLTHTNHNTLMTGSTNNWWKYCTWSIITSKTGFTHATTIINNKCCYIVVTHDQNFSYEI